MSPSARFRLGLSAFAVLVAVGGGLVLAGVEWGLALVLFAGVLVLAGAWLFRCPRCRTPYLYEGPIAWAHPTWFPRACRKCGHLSDQV